MNLALVIYFIGVMNGIVEMCTTVFVLAIFVSGAVLLVGGIHSIDEGMEGFKAITKPFAKPLIILLISSAVIGTVVPTKNTAYAMLAAYGGQSIIESDAVQRLAPKSLELLEGYMDKQLAEVKEAK